MRLLPRLSDPTPPTVPHASVRWAHAVLGVLHCSHDPTTINAWGRVIGASGSAIRQWCRSAGVRPKAALDFARVLRAVALSQGRSWDVYNLLDIVDERTMRNLFIRAGMPEVLGTPVPPETARYLSRQRFVGNKVAVQAIVALLGAEAPRSVDDGPAAATAT